MARVTAPTRFSPRALTTLVAVATLATVAAGCAQNVLSPGGSGVPLVSAAPKPEDRLHQQARDALERWADAVRANGGASITFVGEMTSQIGTWEVNNEDNKAALEAGAVGASSDLSEERPGRREVKWVDGTKVDVEVLSARQALDELVDTAPGDCGGCDPLRVTDANLATGLMETSTGPAEVPMWVYSLRGSAVRITRVAVDGGVTVDPPPWDAEDPPAGLSIHLALGEPGSRKVQVEYVGADESCGLEPSVEAVESDLAIVVIVDELPGQNGAQACRLVGRLKTAEVTLDAQLDDRVVLEGRQGLPVPVHAP
ncbi:MAG TPA: hypothetical protein VFP56_04205 [Candidatus Limnocylindrales bacterium]|nr:hypothetical protein [Candidatus Limnocylindrales bacterium]